MSKQTDEHFLDINGLEILYEKNEFFPLLKFQVFFSVLASEFVISVWVSCFVEQFLSPFVSLVAITNDNKKLYFNNYLIICVFEGYIPLIVCQTSLSHIQQKTKIKTVRHMYVCILGLHNEKCPKQIIIVSQLLMSTPAVKS